MTLDRRKLFALGVAGGLWVIGLSVFVFVYAPVFVPAAILYVGVFSLLIASRRRSAIPTMLMAWAVAAAAFGTTLASGSSGAGEPSEVGFGIVMGGVLGTVMFVGWMATAFLVLLAVDPERRTVIP